MEASLDLSCNVCLGGYSNSNVPRNLSCGHSACSSCLEKIIITIRKECPECRRKFQAKSVSDLAVNYPILRLSHLNNFVHFDQENIPSPSLSISYPTPNRQESAGICGKHGCPMFFRCLRCCVWVCRDCLLECHPDAPYGKCIILTIRKALDKIKSSQQRTLGFYLSDAHFTKIKWQHYNTKFAKVIEFCGKKKYKNENEDYEEELQEFITQKENTEILIPVLQNLTELLRQASKKMNEANDRDDVLAANDFVMECETAFEKFMVKEGNRKFPKCWIPFSRGKKTLKDLMEAEKTVYAVQVEDGKSRWCLLELKENCILLYSLRDGDPPEDGITLPYFLLRELVSWKFSSVFLELGLEGQSKGHVHIRVLGNTARGHQTVLLCSGERGPSYRETAFQKDTLMVNNSNTPIDVLKGGDYEKNNGTGGRAIVDDIVEIAAYQQTVVAGLMVGWPPEEDWRLGSFYFYLHDAPLVIEDCAFGIVTKGLELLRSVGPMIDACVMDCGLVIPFISPEP